MEECSPHSPAGWTSIPLPPALPHAGATAGVTPASPSASLSHKQGGESGDPSRSQGSDTRPEEPRERGPGCEGGFWGGCSRCLLRGPGLRRCPSSWRNQTKRKLCFKKT